MPSLTIPQAKFLALPERFRAFVSGFGGGKTWAGCAGMCATSWQHPGAKLGYFGPTHSHTRDIFYPTIEEVADDWGLDCDIFPSNREVILSHGGIERTVIKCRSMDRPDGIVGFKIARAVVDEIDTLPALKATSAWNKIIGRLRQEISGLQNGADVTTTPEGYGFAYQTFKKAPRDKPELRELYSLVQCSTYDNEQNLPVGYIHSMRVSYTLSLIEAYLMGMFTNLTQGSVYREFNRKLNASTRVIREGDVLHIGIDFNVGQMSAIIHIKDKQGDPHAVDEIVGALDTPDLVRLIKEKYWTWSDENEDFRRVHKIIVYPDSTGGSRKSVEASKTDIELLKRAGFEIRAAKANPPVRDRVNSLNAMICNSVQVRRYKVNVEQCPTLTESLEQQAYNALGEPDKDHNQDHPNDATGYFVHREYPLKRPVTKLRIGVAA